jgi:hypothetical protein
MLWEGAYDLQPSAVVADAQVTLVEFLDEKFVVIPTHLRDDQ